MAHHKPKRDLSKPSNDRGDPTGIDAEGLKWLARCEKWRATVRDSQNRPLFLGMFNSRQLAVAAMREKEKQLSL